MPCPWKGDPMNSALKSWISQRPSPSRVFVSTPFAISALPPGSILISVGADLASAWLLLSPIGRHVDLAGLFEGRDWQSRLGEGLLEVGVARQADPDLPAGAVGVLAIVAVVRVRRLPVGVAAADADIEGTVLAGG